MYKHNSGMFRVGDKVRIVLKVTQATGWTEFWNSQTMDQLVGKEGVVQYSEGSSGFCVQTGGGERYWYPSCALGLISSGKAPALLPQAPTKNAKKRVRVGKGPWDNAPCPHLRWHLMGFFREKLMLIKASGNTVVEEVEVGCPKCKTTMILKAR